MTAYTVVLGKTDYLASLDTCYVVRVVGATKEGAVTAALEATITDIFEGSVPHEDIEVLCIFEGHALEVSGTAVEVVANLVERGAR